MKYIIDKRHLALPTKHSTLRRFGTKMEGRLENKLATIGCFSPIKPTEYAIEECRMNWKKEEEEKEKKNESSRKETKTVFFHNKKRSWNYSFL